MAGITQNKQMPYFHCGPIYYSKCDQASELESGLWDTVDWGRKWLLDFNGKKTQLVSFD